MKNPFPGATRRIGAALGRMAAWQDQQDLAEAIEFHLDAPPNLGPEELAAWAVQMHPRDSMLVVAALRVAPGRPEVEQAALWNASALRDPWVQISLASSPLPETLRGLCLADVCTDAVFRRAWSRLAHMDAASALQLCEALGGRKNLAREDLSPLLSSPDAEVRLKAMLMAAKLPSTAEIDEQRRSSSLVGRLTRRN